VRNSLGNLSEAQGDFATALRLRLAASQPLADVLVVELAKAVRVQPSDSRGYNDRGLGRLSLGQYLDAIQDFDQALTMEPRNADFHFNRGQAYSGLNDYRRAMEDFDQAISISWGKLYSQEPRFFLYFFNRGLARFNLNDYPGAIEDFDRAILDFPHPDTAEAHVLRGIAYGQLGRADDAARELGEYVSAIDDLNLGYRLHSRPSSAYYSRGLARFHLGNYLQAISYYDEAIRLDPRFALAYYNRASAYTSLGRTSEAQQDVDRATELGLDRTP
jgi:tetratricopeptide (TPR) repeat protein